MNAYLISKLKEGRIKKGLKQSDVTQFTGIKNTTLSNYENGITEPDIDTFLQLCELYELDYARILAEAYGLSVQGEDFKIRPSEIEVAKKYRFISTHSPEGAKVVDTVLDREYSVAEQLNKQNEQINELEQTIAEKDLNNPGTRLINYYYRLASAGTGQIIFDTPPTKRIEIPDTPENQKAAYAIGVNGNSMEPVYHDGDTLLIEMTEDLQLGDIGIFLVNGESYIKKLGDQELISLNPKYENIPLGEDSYCLGKVLSALE